MLLQNALFGYEQETLAVPHNFHAGILRNWGLIAVKGGSRETVDLLDVLVNSKNSKRVAGPQGPFMLLQQEGRRLLVISPVDLLGDADQNIRVNAVRFFQLLPEMCMSLSTKGVIDKFLEKIASDSPDVWIPSARKIYSLIKSDVLLAIAAVKQCYFFGIKDVIDECLEKIIRPNVDMIESLCELVYDPFEGGAAKGLLDGMVDSRIQVSDIVRNYCYFFGNMPLTGEFSLGAVLRKWVNGRAGVDVWKMVWEWTDNQSSPLSRYHVCAAFLENPELVPQGSEVVLWREIASIVNDFQPTSGQDPRKQESWLLRQILALHFVYYVECLVPGLRGDRIIGIAWWLTERVCEALPESLEVIGKVRLDLEKSEMKMSRFVNNITHPFISRAGYSKSADIVFQIWAVSIITELGKAEWLFERKKPSVKNRAQIRDRIMVSIFDCNVYSPSEMVEYIYSFNAPISGVVKSWRKHNIERNVDYVDRMDEIVENGIMLASNEALEDFVSILGVQKDDLHLRAARALRHKIYSDSKIAGPLFDLLERNGALEKILKCVNEECLYILLDAFVVLAVRDGGSWRESVPHFFALSGECSSDLGRKKIFFNLTIYASIALGTTSALNRLMHGCARSEFALFCKQWHGKLKSALNIAAPWAVSRIRAALPSLVPDKLVGVNESW